MISKLYATEDADGVYSYEWENVVRLSGTGKAIKNAENFAYFGVIASLITPRTPEDVSMRINKEGEVQVFFEVST